MSPSRAAPVRRLHRQGRKPHGRQMAVNTRPHTVRTCICRWRTPYLYSGLLNPGLRQIILKTSIFYLFIYSFLSFPKLFLSSFLLSFYFPVPPYFILFFLSGSFMLLSVSLSLMPHGSMLSYTSLFSVSSNKHSGTKTSQ